MSQLRIALIGSRSLEDHKDASLYYDVCYRLAQLGIIATSGLAPLGADAIMQKAYSQALAEGHATIEQFEVYVAEQKNIIRSTLPNKHLAIVRNPNLIKETYILCQQVMEASHWRNCGDWAKGMHSRNCHQIFGYDLQSPVDAVICWTPNGAVVGGTRTALLLAQNAGIPIFNLGRPDQDNVKAEIRAFLLQNNVVGVK